MQFQFQKWATCLFFSGFLLGSQAVLAETAAPAALAEPPPPASTASPPPLTTLPPPTHELLEDWHFAGQVLLRTEMDGRDFDNSTSPLFWTVMRTRLAVSKTFFKKDLEFFVQLQDSRTFGDVGAAIANLRNIDLYQGYVQAHHLLGQDLTLQIGRFELDYGNGRLFSPLPGWNYIGQSFDGGRIKYRLPEFFELSVEAFSTVIKNTTQAIRNPTPTAYPLKSNPGHGLHGIWATADLAKEAKLDAFVYYEIDSNETKAGFADINRTTFGLNHRGKYLDGFVTSTVEADFQLGKVSDLNVNAFLFSASAFLHPGEFMVGAGADFLSGNAPGATTTNHAFSQPFGNNFAFYGYMDYFLNVAVNSKNLGLNDYYLKTAWAPSSIPLEVSLNFHHMAANQAAASGQSIYGHEADLTVTYKQDKNRYIWGLSAYLPGGLFSSADFFGSNRKDLAFWSYLQAIINF